MVQNAPGLQRSTSMPTVAVVRTVSVLQPLVHRAHGWVVDVTTHSISKRRCPACEAESDHILAEAAASAKAG